MQSHQQWAERNNLQRVIDRLQLDAPLAGSEQAMIRNLWRSARHQRAHVVLTDCGPRLITSGWAAVLRYGEGGGRQVFLFLLPGDFIVSPLFRMELCSVASLTPLRTVDASTLLENAEHTPCSAALIGGCERYYRLLLLDHLTRLTAGCTTRSVAHMLTELHARSVQSGACAEGRFSFPIGQRVLASALGRSTVQINKIIKQFQADGLLSVGYDWLQLNDPERLQMLSGLTHSVLQPARTNAALNVPTGSIVEA